MIHYVTGSAVEPKAHGTRIIAHVCNDVGAWGRGFVVAISDKWREPAQVYRSNFKGRFDSEKLRGTTDFVTVDNHNGNMTCVANMIAQRGIASPENTGQCLVDFVALKKCLQTVSAFASSRKDPTIHMPRIGCGLGGAKWEDIEPLLNETLGDLNVFVYDLPQKQ